MTEKEKPKTIDDEDLETVQGGAFWGGGVSKNPIANVADGTAEFDDGATRRRTRLSSMSEGESDGV